MEIEEIKQAIYETKWELDQGLKCLFGQFNFQIFDKQHKEWYIVVLLLHLSLLLSQQNIALQDDALEITMNIEAFSIQDTHIGV